MNSTSGYEIGALIAGKYEVRGVLGSGGMGKVYDVLQVQIGKRRALKILRSDEGFSRETVSRFQREIKADAAIQNEHVVEVFDAGELDDGQPYVVMERLEGETLGSLLRRKGQLGLEELCELMRQVCQGIQAAHDAGILHRDLKPANIFVTTRQGKPFVKILDFGIAKFLRKDAEDMTVTREGTLLGTPCYMAPEQIRGMTDLDERTDVYALGVILYECATGRVPYRAESSALLGVLICEGKPPRLGELRPDLPECFRDIVMRAMAADRNGRFASARALGQALRNLADGIQESPRLSGTDAWLKSTARVERDIDLRRIQENGSTSTRSSNLKVRSTKAGLVLAGALFALLGLGVVPLVGFAQWSKEAKEPRDIPIQNSNAVSSSWVPQEVTSSAICGGSEDAPIQSMGTSSPASIPTRTKQSIPPTIPSASDRKDDPGIINTGLPTD